MICVIADYVVKYFNSFLKAVTLSIHWLCVVAASGTHGDLGELETHTNNRKRIDIHPTSAGTSGGYVVVLWYTGSYSKHDWHAHRARTRDSMTNHDFRKQCSIFSYLQMPLSLNSHVDEFLIWLVFLQMSVCPMPSGTPSKSCTYNPNLG